jgi:hypothetical protein
MTDTTNPQADELSVARATNQRLNARAQRLEAELAAYRRAVAQWEISDQMTYVPLRSLAAIATAAGLAVPEQWELHYQRLQRAEAAAVPVPASAPTDRAALLAEAIRRVEDPKERASTVGSGLGWESARDVLRRMADAVPVSGPGGAADETRAPCGRSSAMPTPCSAGDHCCTGPSKAQQPAAVAQPDGEA